MTGKEIFKVWAPTGKKWTGWVRPVPFVGMKEHSKDYNYADFVAPVIDYLGKEWEDAAIIVDLPGEESVEEGIALAGLGYRPIPIYNGTIEQQGARATVDNQTVGIALEWGAAELSKVEIEDDALPAFLLDNNRLQRYKMEDSLFDNSWDVYAQDMPSADFLLKNGIRKVVVIGEFFSDDLKVILYDYQKKKIDIYFTDRYRIPQKYRIHKFFLQERD